MAKPPLLLIALLLSSAAGCNRSNQDRLSDEQVRGTSEDTSPEQRCASRATYDQLKRELFGEAARLRTGDGAAVERLSDEAEVRMRRPRLIRNDQATGLIACRGQLTLELPRGYSTATGRTALSAEVDYALQEGPQGLGDTVTLTGADRIVEPLATIGPAVARSADAPLDPADPTYDGPGERMPPVDELAPLSPPPPPSPPSPPQSPAPARPSEARSTPSFDCRHARTRSEQAVCASDELASLDRRMAALYNGGMADADAETRAVLRATRDRFLAWREGCASEACIADAYRGRMAEIRDILAEGSLRR